MGCVSAPGWRDGARARGQANGQSSSHTVFLSRCDPGDARRPVGPAARECRSENNHRCHSTLGTYGFCVNIPYCGCELCAVWELGAVFYEKTHILHHCGGFVLDKMCFRKSKLMFNTFFRQYAFISFIIDYLKIILNAIFESIKHVNLPCSHQRYGEQMQI